MTPRREWTSPTKREHGSARRRRSVIDAQQVGVGDLGNALGGKARRLQIIPNRQALKISKPGFARLLAETLSLGEYSHEDVCHLIAEENRCFHDCHMSKGLYKCVSFRRIFIFDDPRDYYRAISYKILSG